MTADGVRFSRRGFVAAGGMAALAAGRPLSAQAAPSERPAGEIVTPQMLVESLEQAVAAGTPGLSAAIATRRGVVWTGVAGLADLGAGRAIDEATIFGVGSITKMFVTIVILQLVEQGKLSLDAHPMRLLGAAMDGIANAGTMTIGDLLSHTAGVPSWEDDPTWIHRGRGSALDPAHHWGKTEALAFVEGHPALNSPGAAFNYSNSGFTILGLIIEKVTGHSAESEIRARILRPLDLRDSYMEGFERGQPDRLPHRYHFATPTFRETAGIAAGFSEVRPDLVDATGSNLSVEWTAGGIVSSPRDLVLMMRALRDGALLQPSSLSYMEAWRPARPTARMGHGLFQISTAAGAVIGHNGSVLGFTGSTWWAEQGDAVVAVLGNVGSMHAGKIPPCAYDVALNSPFTALALRYAARHGEESR